MTTKSIDVSTDAVRTLKMGKGEYISAVDYIDTYRLKDIIPHESKGAFHDDLVKDANYMHRVLPPLRSREGNEWFREHHVPYYDDPLITLDEIHIVQQLADASIQYSRDVLKEMDIEEDTKCIRLEQFVIESGKYKEKESLDNKEEMVCLTFSLLSDIVLIAEKDESKTQLLISYASKINTILTTPHKLEIKYKTQTREKLSSYIKSLCSFIITNKSTLKSDHISILILLLLRMNIYLGILSVSLWTFYNLLQNHLVSSEYIDSKEFDYYPDGFKQVKIGLLSHQIKLKSKKTLSTKKDANITFDQTRMLIENDRDYDLYTHKTTNGTLYKIDGCTISSGGANSFYALGNLWFSQHSEIGPFSTKSKGYSRHWYYSYSKNDRISNKCDSRLNEVKSDYKGLQQINLIYKDKSFYRLNILCHNDKNITHNIVSLTKYELLSVKYGYASPQEEIGVHRDNKLVMKFFDNINKLHASVIDDYILLHNKINEYALIEINTGKLVELSSNQRSFCINGVDTINRRVYSIVNTTDVSYADISLFEEWNIFREKDADSTPQSYNNPQMIHELGLLKEDEEFEEEEEEIHTTKDTQQPTEVTMKETNMGDSGSANVKKEMPPSSGGAKISPSIIRYMRYISSCVYMIDVDTIQNEQYFCTQHRYDICTQLFDSLLMCMKSIHKIDDVTNRSIFILYISNILNSMVDIVVGLQDKKKTGIKIIGQKALNEMYICMSTLVCDDQYKDRLDRLRCQFMVNAMYLMRRYNRIPIDSISYLIECLTSGRLVWDSIFITRSIKIILEMSNENDNYRETVGMIMKSVMKYTDECIKIEIDQINNFYSSESKNRPDEGMCKKLSLNLQHVMRYMVDICDIFKDEDILREFYSIISKTHSSINSTSQQTKSNWSTNQMRDLDIMIQHSLYVNIFMMIMKYGLKKISTNIVSNGLSEERKKEISQVFNYIDILGSGKIEIKELDSLVKSLKYEIKEDEIKKMKVDLERNNPGSIDLTQCLNTIGSILDGIDRKETTRSWYRLMNTEGKERVKVQYLMEKSKESGDKKITKKLQDMIDNCEVSMDGEISEEEIVSVMMKSGKRENDVLYDMCVEYTGSVCNMKYLYEEETDSTLLHKFDGWKHNSSNKDVVKVLRYEIKTNGDVYVKPTYHDTSRHLFKALLFSRRNGSKVPIYEGLLSNRIKNTSGNPVELIVVILIDKYNDNVVIPTIEIHQNKLIEGMKCSMSVMNDISLEYIYGRCNTIASSIIEKIAKYREIRCMYMSRGARCHIKKVTNVSYENVFDIVDDVGVDREWVYDMIQNDREVHNEIDRLLSMFNDMCKKNKDNVYRCSILMISIYDMFDVYAMRYVMSMDDRWIYDDSVKHINDIYMILYNNIISYGVNTNDDSGRNNDEAMTIMRIMTIISRYVNVSIDMSKILNHKVLNEEPICKREVLEFIAHNSREAVEDSSMQWVSKSINSLMGIYSDNLSIPSYDYVCPYFIYKTIYDLYNNTYDSDISDNVVVEDNIDGAVDAFVSENIKNEDKYYLTYRCMRYMCYVVSMYDASAYTKHISTSVLMKYLTSNNFADMKVYVLHILYKVLPHIDLTDAIHKQYNLVDTLYEQLIGNYKLFKDKEHLLKQQSLVITMIRLFKRLLAIPDFAEAAKSKLKSMVESRDVLSVRLVVDILGDEFSEVPIPGDLVYDKKDYYQRKAILLFSTSNPEMRLLFNEYLNYSEDFSVDRLVREHGLENRIDNKYIVKSLRSESTPELKTIEEIQISIEEELRLKKEDIVEILKNCGLLEHCLKSEIVKTSRLDRQKIISLLERMGSEVFSKEIEALKQHGTNPRFLEMRKKVLKSLKTAYSQSKLDSEVMNRATEEIQSYTQENQVNLADLFGNSAEKLKERLIKGILAGMMIDTNNTSLSEERRVISLNKDDPYTVLDLSRYSRWVIITSEGERFIDRQEGKSYYLGIAEEETGGINNKKRRIATLIKDELFPSQDLPAKKVEVKEVDLENKETPALKNLDSSKVLLVPSIYTMKEDEFEAFKNKTEDHWSKKLLLFNKLIERNSAFLVSISDSEQCEKLVKKMGPNGEELLRILSRLDEDMWSGNPDGPEKVGKIFKLKLSDSINQDLSHFSRYLDNVCEGKVKNRANIELVHENRETNQFKDEWKAFLNKVFEELMGLGILRDSPFYTERSKRKTILGFKQMSKSHYEKLYQLGILFGMIYKFDLTFQKKIALYIAEGLSDLDSKIEWRFYEEVDSNEFKRIEGISELSEDQLVTANVENYIRLIDDTKLKVPGNESREIKRLEERDEFVKNAKRYLIYQLEEPLRILRKGFYSIVSLADTDSHFKSRLRNAFTALDNEDVYEFEDSSRLRRVLTRWLRLKYQINLPEPESESKEEKAPEIKKDEVKEALHVSEVVPSQPKAAAPAEEEEISLGGLFD